MNGFVDKVKALGCTVWAFVSSKVFLIGISFVVGFLVGITAY